MGDIIDKGKGSGLVSLLHGQGSLSTDSGNQGSVAIPKPFEHDIFLFDTHIAGTSFIEGIGELISKIDPDAKLNFFREPDNKYDKMAIVIKDPYGNKLGYVPRSDNAIFARLMDAGKILFGRIEDKEKFGTWEKVKIKVYLHE